MRDPFPASPEDRCRYGTLAVAISGARYVKASDGQAFQKDSQQKWRREWEEGQTLKIVGTIVRLTVEALTLTTGKIARRSGGGYVRERAMQRWIAIILIVFLMPAAQAGKAAKVTLVVDDVPVAGFADFSRAGAAESGGGVAGRQRTLSLHLTDVPWKQALRFAVNSAACAASGGEYSSCSFTGPQKEHCARQDAERLRLQATSYRWKTAAYAIRRMPGEPAKAGEKLLEREGELSW